MHQVLAVLAGYFAVSFVLATVTVRVAPRGRIGRDLRRHSALMLMLPPWLPLLLLWRVAAVLLGVFRWSFEALSGHRLYRRRRYGLYSYGR